MMSRNSFSIKLLALALASCLVAGEEGPNFCSHSDHTCVEFSVSSPLKEVAEIEIARTGMHGCAKDIRTMTLGDSLSIAGHMDTKCSYEVTFKFNDGTTNDKTASFSRNNLKRGMNQMVLNTPEDSDTITITKSGAGTATMVKTFPRMAVHAPAKKMIANETVSRPVDLEICDPSEAGSSTCLDPALLGKVLAQGGTHSHS